MKKLLILLIFISAIAVFAHDNHPHVDKRGFESIPYTDIEFNNDPDNFQFVIVTDRTGGHRTGIFESAVGKINLLQPEFVMCVGDLIEGYTTDLETLNEEWDEFNGIVSNLEMPFFYVPGNHDFSNDVMANLWKEKYGADYYHFIYKDVLFIAMNSEDSRIKNKKETAVFGAGITTEQLGYFKKVLDDNKDVRWTLIFMHQPLYAYENTPNWDKMQDYLKGRKHSVFAGHMHRYSHYKINNSDYITLGTTGGGSRLRGKAYGEFDHVVWVTMKDDGPVLANVLLDGIEDKLVTTEYLHKKFSSNPVLRPEPLFVDGDNFTGGTAGLNVVNDFNFPLEVKVEFYSNSSLIPSETMYEVKVAPNSTEKIDIDFKSITGEINSDNPVKSIVNCKLIRSESDKLVWDQQLNIVPIKKHYVEEADMEVVLDGKIDEWGELAYSSQELTVKSMTDSSVGYDENDASYKFDMRYDDKFLYVAARVKDDEIINKFYGKHDGQDSFIFTLDARPYGISSMNAFDTESLKSGEWMLMILAPDDEKGFPIFGDFIPDSFKMSAITNDSGYTVEIGIPIEYLNFKYGGNWKDMRVNTAMFDVDSDRNFTTQTNWGIGWDKNIPGTGTFFKK